MRQLILKMSMSIDGFVCGPNGELDWLFETRDDESTAWTVERVSRAGVHAMGSHVFRDMAAYWPASTEPFAPPMNTIPKVVFSRRGKQDGPTTRGLEDARAQGSGPAATAARESWDAARWMVGDLREQVERLKAEDGKPIIAHGGAELARNLVAFDLVDELALLVHPIALGRGLSPFAGLDARRRMKLVEAIAFPGGTVAHVYARA